jgi:hypothetical protein
MLCAVGSGTGRSLALKAIVTGNLGTATNVFTFDAPTTTFINTFNLAASANVIVTLFGTNFGAQPTGMDIRVGTTSCICSSWKSSSQAECRVPDGLGAATTVAATVSDVVGTALFGFTYDSPVITRSNRMNGPSTGGSSLTLFGMNFGVYDGTASIRIGGRICTTVAWFTGTKMLCRLPPGTGLAQNVDVPVSANIGTQYIAITYDSPVVTYIGTPNGPTVTGRVTTVNGVNFGTLDATATVLVGGTAAQSVTYVSATTLNIQRAAGSGRDKDVLTIVDGLVHKAVAGFTFDAAVITVMVSDRTVIMSGSNALPPI